MHNQYDEENFFNMYKEIRHSPLSYNEIVEFPEIQRYMPDLKTNMFSISAADLGIF